MREAERKVQQQERRAREWQRANTIRRNHEEDEEDRAYAQREGREGDANLLPDGSKREGIPI